MSNLLDFLFGEIPRPNEDLLKRLDETMDSVRVQHINQTIMWAILTRVEWKVSLMANNWQDFDADLTTLIDGYQASRAENAVLRDQLSKVDVATRHRIEEALAADEAADQELIDAADAKVREGIKVPEVDPNGGTTPDQDPGSVDGGTSGGASEAPPEVQANVPDDAQQNASENG